MESAWPPERLDEAMGTVDLRLAPDEDDAGKFGFASRQGSLAQPNGSAIGGDRAEAMSFIEQAALEEASSVQYERRMFGATEWEPRPDGQGQGHSPDAQGIVRMHADRRRRSWLLAVNAGRPESASDLALLAPPVGLEPTTRCLEGSRSVQLSYRGVTPFLPLFGPRGSQGCGSAFPSRPAMLVAARWP